MRGSDTDLLPVGRVNLLPSVLNPVLQGSDLVKAELIVSIEPFPIIWKKLTIFAVPVSGLIRDPRPPPSYAYLKHALEERVRLRKEW